MSEQEPNVKRIDEMSITERMRHYLQPQGTAPVVGLHLSNRFFNHDFVVKCIEELERMPSRALVGEGPSNLEKLAYTLLCDSAYIEMKETK